MSNMTWRPKQRLGKLRERIAIQSASVDESDGQPSRTWSNLYASVPASYDPATGGETSRGRQTEANVKAVFTTRYLSGVTPEHRVVYGGENYGIVAIVRVAGGRRYMDIHCRGVA
jgi:SPP1 family predicted phage head-tail adaptor